MDQHGIQSCPAKEESIVNWPVPTSADELRTFVGMIEYHCKAIKNFAQLTSPLYELQNQHPWGKRTGRMRCPVATPPVDFDTLKQKLTSSPVLAFPDFSSPFILEVDASHQGLGAVLLQDQPAGRRVIAYASRGLWKAERNVIIQHHEARALRADMGCDGKVQGLSVG